MSELLSQQEIDLLLKSGGEQSAPVVNDNEIIPYDFRLPNRITKTQLRTIRNIHENFAESFGKTIHSKSPDVLYR